MQLESESPIHVKNSSNSIAQRKGDESSLFTDKQLIKSSNNDTKLVYNDGEQSKYTFLRKDEDKIENEIEFSNMNIDSLSINNEVIVEAIKLKKKKEDEENKKEVKAKEELQNNVDDDIIIQSCPP